MALKEVLSLSGNANTIEDYVQFLESENIKLRGIVADMWRFAIQRMDYADSFSFAGDFVDRIRELEIKF